MSTDLAISEKNQGFMAVSTIDQAVKVSELLAQSNFCPTSMKGKPGDILVCLQMGQELGLKPMQSIQNIAVINGRPSIWGDAMLAVCRQSPDFEYIKEDFDVSTMAATCIVKRKNEPEFISAFSQADAITACLWKKAGPWTTYPKRMLQMRARGFALRDCFPDLLRGIIIKEEAEDYPTKRINYSKVEGVTFENTPASIVMINDEQIMELKTLAAELGANLKLTCEYFNIDSIDQLSTSQWSDVMRQFERKLLKRDELNMQTNSNIEHTMTEAAKEFFGEAE